MNLHYNNFKKKIKKNSGRNNQGKITIRHRGGGSKRTYRHLDLYRQDFFKANIPFIKEYDPNRSAFVIVTQVYNKKKKFKMILFAEKTSITKPIFDCVNTEKPFFHTNSFFLKNIPVGAFIYNVEKKPKGGGFFARSAGTFCEIIDKSKKNITLKLPSGELKKVSKFCRGSIGIVNNSNHFIKKKRKAGETRWVGRRPTVRGVAINPIDHPHGGGEGKGRVARIPVSPWGRIKKGKKK